MAITLLGLAGCAPRQPVQVTTKPMESRWESCQETVRAEPDGFQHFICIDKKGRKWEIDTRLVPK